MNNLDFARLTYPRVSDIIGAQTEKEMRAIPIEHLANASIRGTQVHNYCLNYIQGLFNPEIEPEYKPYVDAFIQWFDQNVTQVICPSHRLYDDEMMFTGEFDFVAKLSNKRIALIDIKTSCNPSKSWPLQLAAYKHLCSLYDYKIETAYNIHLKKTKPAVFKTIDGNKILMIPPMVKGVDFEYEDLTKSWKVFESALECYKFFHKKEGKQDVCA